MTGFRFIFLFVLMGLAPEAPAFASVLGFREWKAVRVFEAKNEHAKLSKSLKKLRKSDISRAEERALNQARMNISIAQDLSPNDYFILYLSQKYRGQKPALLAASKKLSSADMAEILSSYQRLIEISSAPKSGHVPGFSSREVAPR